MNQENYGRTQHGQQQRDGGAGEDRTVLLAAFRATFGSEHGRRVLAYLDASANYGKPSFLPSPDGQPYDPIAAAIRDGRKSILAEIHEAIGIEEDGGGEREPRGIA